MILGLSIIVLILIVMNIRKDVKFLLTPLVNIIVLLACGGLDILMMFIKACFDFSTGPIAYSFVYQSDYIVRIVIISCILTAIMIGFKVKFKMKENLILFIVSFLFTLGFINLAIPVIFTENDIFTDLCSLGEYIKHCSAFVVPLLLQTNLFINFINSNRHCFNKEN